MLLKIENDVLQCRCNRCAHEFESPVKVDAVHENEVTGYNAYPNDPCPSCGLIEAFNVNLPLTDADDAENESIPYLDVNQRYYIRQLMHRVRPDLKEGN